MVGNSLKRAIRLATKVINEFGFEIVNRFVKEAGAYGQADAPPKLLGDRDLNVTLSPLPRNKRAKHPRGETTPEPPPNPPPPPPPVRIYGEPSRASCESTSPAS